MSKTCHKLFIMTLVFSFLFFLSCPLVTLTDLTITFFPQGQSFILQAGESVRIVFGSDVDQKSVEDAFSIHGAGTTVAGHLEWNGREAEFLPDLPYMPKTPYTLSLSGQIDSADKVFTYKKNMVIGFYYLDDSPRTTLIADETIPVNRASVGIDSVLEFHFSSPMDPEKLQTGLSLSPAFEYTPVWNGLNTEVVLTPNEDLLAARVYTWKMTTSFLDSDQVPLAWEAEGWFSTTTDAVRPQIIITAPAALVTYDPLLSGALPDWTALEKMTPLIVRFSEDMKMDSLLSAISFSPSVSGNWSPNGTTDYIFFPSTGWKMDQEYIMKISTAAADLNGLGIEQEYSLQFMAEGIPLQTIDSIVINNGTDHSIDPSDLNTNDLASVIQLQLPATDPFVINTTITFSQSYGLNERPILANAISFSHIFPDDDDAANPLLEQITWNPAGTAITLTWSTFTESTLTIRRFYKLTVKGTDSLTSNAQGSYLSEDTWFFFEAIP